MKNENNKIVSVDDALEKHYKQKKEIERLTLGLLVGMTITLGVTASSIRDGELNTDKSIDTFPVAYYQYHTYKKDQNNVWIDNGEITVTTPMSSNDSVRYDFISSYIKNEYNQSKNDLSGGELNTDKSIDTFPITYYHYHTYKKDQNNVWIDNGEITVTTPMSSNDSVRYEYIDSYIKNEYNSSKNDQIVEKEENMGLR